MDEKRFICEIESEGGITLISNMEGYILDPSELLKIAEELIYTVNHYSDAIEEYNKFRLEKRLECSSKKQKKRDSRVYLMKCGNRYKIGVAIDVDRRLRALNERPFKIELVEYSQPIPNAYRVEKEIHTKLEKNRIRGEWFKLSEEEAHQISEQIRLLGMETEL